MPLPGAVLPNLNLVAVAMRLKLFCDSLAHPTFIQFLSFCPDKASISISWRENLLTNTVQYM